MPVKKTPAPPEKPRALIGWRLLGLLYDLWPVLALWMLLGAAFTLGYYYSGHGARENIPPFSPLQLLLWVCCWVITGAYATLSWRRGGQTLGMRPWRLQVVSTEPGTGSLKLGQPVPLSNLSVDSNSGWSQPAQLNVPARFS